MTAGPWTTALSAGPLLVAIIGAAWLVSARLTALDMRLAGVERSLDGLAQRLDALAVRVEGLHRRVDNVEGRIDRLERALGERIATLEGDVRAGLAQTEAGLRQTRAQFQRLDQGVRGSIATTLTALVRNRALPGGEAVEAALGPWQAEIHKEDLRPNPLTREELGRFDLYYQKVARREPLEYGEVRDCEAIVDRLFEAEPDDPNVLILLGLPLLLQVSGLVKPARGTRGAPEAAGG